MHDIPGWLHPVAQVSLLLAVVCAIAVGFDIWVMGRRQRMAVMNLVWPLTALYGGPLGLYVYWRLGRAAPDRRPFRDSVVIGATHCGSGCALGDILAESFVVVPLSLFGSKVFGTWALDYVLAFLFGIAFQYFSIVPMRQLSPGRGLVAALKADTLSLTAWQVGMYGWMALVLFVFFGEIPKSDPVFWFMMQIAMLFGFATSAPVNAWLIRRGIKERM